MKKTILWPLIFFYVFVCMHFVLLTNFCKKRRLSIRLCLFTFVTSEILTVWIDFDYSFWGPYLLRKKRKRYTVTLLSVSLYVCLSKAFISRTLGDIDLNHILRSMVPWFPENIYIYLIKENKNAKNKNNNIAKNAYFDAMKGIKINRVGYFRLT